MAQEQDAAIGEATLAPHEITMYSKDGCPFCEKALAFFDKHKLSYSVHYLNNDADRQAFYARTGTKSVPQIFWNDPDGQTIHLGGYDDLIRKKNYVLGPRMKQVQEAYVVQYPEAVEFAKTQNDVVWFDTEIEVSKDVQDIMVNLSESERHGVITVLKLFTLYELFAGDEYWGGRVHNMFPRPDIRRMANCFSFFEINSHAPFYNKLNEALSLNTEEFYTDYVEDDTLRERMEFVDRAVNNPDDLVSLAVFSMVEGAVLYSSFAYLKHFQSKGKNKLLNVVRGINFSVRDENLHAEGGAWLYRTLKKEMDECDRLNTYAMCQADREEIIKAAAHKLYEHECRIIDMIFEKGRIEGITDVQMKHFVQSRINECLRRLDIAPIFEVSYDPISRWFYDGINSYQFHDFFTGSGSDYNRDWDETGFEW